VSCVVRTTSDPPSGGVRAPKSWLPDLDVLSFQGAEAESVTVTLAADPAGVFTGSRALLTLVGPGVLRNDASALPNSASAALPVAGTYYVAVTELLVRQRFAGAYCVTLESSQQASGTLAPH
jgi:hypothetical protein